MRDTGWVMLAKSTGTLGVRVHAISNSAGTVALVVVTYNSERLIEDFLNTLDEGLQGVAWHLNVADNASTDETVAVVRRLAPSATLVEMGRNAGYAAGINAAVAATGPHSAILALNPDVRLMPNCVTKLMNGMRKGTGRVVPRLVDSSSQLMESTRREPTVLQAWVDALLGARHRYPVLGEVVTDARLYDREIIADWAEGSVILISWECWEQCGPWDESYFLYSEETDFALRARDAGFVTRFMPSARAVHLGGESATSPGLWSLLTINKVLSFSRRNGRMRTLAYWAALVLREASSSLPGRTASREAVKALLSPRQLSEPLGPQIIRI